MTLLGVKAKKSQNQNGKIELVTRLGYYQWRGRRQRAQDFADCWSDRTGSEIPPEVNGLPKNIGGKVGRSTGAPQA